MLINSSGLNGAFEYFYGRAVYFAENSYTDFQRKLLKYWKDPPAVSHDHRRWVRERYDDCAMLGEIRRAICEKLGRTA